MKRISILAVLFISACGGGQSQSPSASVPPPQPVVVTGPVVFIGDSITEFWESGPFTVPSPKLSELVPGSVNAGHSGNRTDEMLARFQVDVLDKHPSVVVILGGTNDIRQLEAPTTDNINTMADRAAASGAKVVICLVPPASVALYPTRFDQATNDAHIRAFNQQLRNLAAGFGYRVVDYYGALTNADGSQNVALFVSTDLIHPNADGYRAMWPLLQSSLR
jgi:lysophospholipase L1-like esterase